MEQFDKKLGKDQIAVFHINDSKNSMGAGKDRHANIGEGTIGFDTLRHIVHHPDFPGHSPGSWKRPTALIRRIRIRHCLLIKRKFHYYCRSDCKYNNPSISGASIPPFFHKVPDKFDISYHKYFLIPPGG